MYAPNRHTILDNSKAYVVRTVCHIVTCITGESVTFQQPDTHVIMRANHGWRNAEPALQFKCWCAKPAPLAGIEVGFSRGSACPAPANWATKCALHIHMFKLHCAVTFQFSHTPNLGHLLANVTHLLQILALRLCTLQCLLLASEALRHLLQQAPVLFCPLPFHWMLSSACSYNSVSHSNSLNYSASTARSGLASHSLQFLASRHCISPFTLSSDWRRNSVVGMTLSWGWDIADLSPNRPPNVMDHPQSEHFMLNFA